VTDFNSPNFIKICGVTNVHDARMIITAGADALGLILTTSSRRVSRESAQSICEAVEGEVLRTLVFRENSEDYILESVTSIGGDIVQVHGPLSVDLAAELHARGFRIIKALAITSDDFHSFDDAIVDAVLLDGPVPGSGQTHSWEALGERSFSKPYIVAGGLRAGNVVQTIGLTNAWGVDCASGVEKSPGIKDPTLVSKFIKNARQGFSQREG
jgi:phosphoribosylanthranilate isomerase